MPCSKIFYFDQKNRKEEDQEGSGLAMMVVESAKRTYCFKEGNLLAILLDTLWLSSCLV